MNKNFNESEMYSIQSIRIRFNLIDCIKNILRSNIRKAKEAFKPEEEEYEFEPTAGRMNICGALPTN
jgi:hypothetical protein